MKEGTTKETQEGRYQNVSSWMCFGTILSMLKRKENKGGKEGTKEGRNKKRKKKEGRKAGRREGRKAGRQEGRKEGRRDHAPCVGTSK